MTLQLLTTMQLKRDQLLLDRALKHLGLHRIFRKPSEWATYDSRNREYVGVSYPSSYTSAWKIYDLTMFLNTKWLRHLKFDNNWPDGADYIENPFYKLTREELAVKLDLLG